MIVKGQIIDIDFTDNTAVVRLPIFESAGSDNIISAKAIFSTIPGVYNTYAINDIVFVGFENNQLKLPIILGKLYLGATEEHNRSATGNLKCNTIEAQNIIGLSTSTKINIDGERDIIPGLFSKINTIGDIISAVQKIDTTESNKVLPQLSADEHIIGKWLDNRIVYAKTIISQSSTISITDLMFDNIWIDVSNSFVSGPKFSSTILGGTINFEEKTIVVNTSEPVSSNVKFIISLRYTKK